MTPVSILSAPVLAATPTPLLEGCRGRDTPAVGGGRASSKGLLCATAAVSCAMSAAPGSRPPPSFSPVAGPIGATPGRSRHLPPPLQSLRGTRSGLQPVSLLRRPAGLASRHRASVPQRGWQPGGTGCGAGTRSGGWPLSSGRPRRPPRQQRRFGGGPAGAAAAAGYFLHGHPPGRPPAVAAALLAAAATYAQHGVQVVDRGWVGLEGWRRARGPSPLGWGAPGRWVVRRSLAAHAPTPPDASTWNDEEWREEGKRAGGGGRKLPGKGDPAAALPPRSSCRPTLDGGARRVGEGRRMRPNPDTPTPPAELAVGRAAAGAHASGRERLPRVTPGPRGAPVY